MDWNRKVLTFIGPKDGHIYDCTISVEDQTEIVREDIMDPNVVCVDMRDVLPRKAHMNKR